MLEHGADVGIAHDGDADRCLAVDADGNVVDGDQIMAILAVSMKERGLLTDDTLVATVMSNLGLRSRDGRARHPHASQTAVGDRYVLEALNEHGFALGGEQSGHVIMTEYATTGDGILTGLHLVAEMARTGKSLAELASVMTVYPQVLVNVRGRRPPRARHRRGRSPRPSRAPRPSSATPAGCCCARRAPSRWCASWSRPPTSRPPTGSPTRSPTSCASAWRSSQKPPPEAAPAVRSAAASGLASDLAEQDLLTAWSASLRSTSDARARVGRMFCAGSAR